MYLHTISFHNVFLASVLMLLLIAEGEVFLKLIAHWRARLGDSGGRICFMDFTILFGMMYVAFSLTSMLCMPPATTMVEKVAMTILPLFLSVVIILSDKRRLKRQKRYSQMSRR